MNAPNKLFKHDVAWFRFQLQGKYFNLFGPWEDFAISFNLFLFILIFTYLFKKIGCLLVYQNRPDDLFPGIYSRKALKARLKDLLQKLREYPRLFTTNNFTIITANLQNLYANPFVLSPLQKRHNFQKYSHGYIDSLGVPYDFESKFPNLTTIRPKRAGVSIGQRGYLTELDVKQMNLYYNCTDHLLLTNFVGQ